MELKDLFSISISIKSNNFGNFHAKISGQILRKQISNKSWEQILIKNIISNKK